MIINPYFENSHNNINVKYASLPSLTLLKKRKGKRFKNTAKADQFQLF